jgi:hypothetical protein
VNKQLTKKPIVVASGASVVTLIGGGLAVGGQAVTWTPFSLTVQVALVCRSVMSRQVWATSAGVR